MAGLIDAFRAAVDAGHRAADSIGVRTYLVRIRTETYSTDIGNGASVASTTDVQLSPTPKVVQVGAADPSWFSAGIVVKGNGRREGLVFNIGPIVLPYNTGGYSAQQLDPANAATNRRVTVFLTGPDLDANGEPFVIRRLWASSSQCVMLTVQHTADGT